jgi:hypothetical protein
MEIRFNLLILSPSTTAVNTMNLLEEVQKEAAGINLDKLVQREFACGIFGEYARLKYLSNAPGHVKKQLERAKKFPHLYALQQGFTGLVITDPPPASFTAVGASSTAEANLWQLPSLWSAIPAGDMRAGKIYVVECFGVCSTSSTPTVTWTGRVGQSTTPATNISLGASTAVATGSGLSAVPFYASLRMQVRSVGVAASGATCIGAGFAVLGNAAAAAAQVAVFGGTVPTNVDSTVAQGLVISITFGTSNAGNTFTTQTVFIRSYN